ncbi:hypothetical protein R3P38DRAFT_2810501 [Favolaschia claudopus]|uniref:Uncharacterized protein n=1 Tax=Favolaschia claudopus TaxID=2862362 RepID=A0AAV9ZAY3_9AGAR
MPGYVASGECRDYVGVTGREENDAGSKQLGSREGYTSRARVSGGNMNGGEAVALTTPVSVSRRTSGHRQKRGSVYSSVFMQTAVLGGLELVEPLRAPIDRKPATSSESMESSQLPGALEPEENCLDVAVVDVDEDVDQSKGPRVSINRVHRRK